jgi:hypothetical protein
MVDVCSTHENIEKFLGKSGRNTGIKDVICGCRRRWEYNIKVEFYERCEGLIRFYLAEDMKQRRPLVNQEIDLPVTLKAGRFLDQLRNY